jgi:hypothetical protein
VVASTLVVVNVDDAAELLNQRRPRAGVLHENVPKRSHLAGEQFDVRRFWRKRYLEERRPDRCGLSSAGQRLSLNSRNAAKGAGRDPRSLSISIFAAGNPEESKLYRQRELGVERVILGVRRADVDVKEKVPPLLDRYAKFIPKLA